MVKEFQGKYRFLSNFYIEPDGTHVESHYQAMKVYSPICRVFIRFMSPGDSKRIGRHIWLRPDWELVKINIMHDLVKEKFTDYDVMGDALLSTGDEELIEGNYWHDTFWGVCTCVKHHNTGENNLGKILMLVRNELKEIKS